MAKNRMQKLRAIPVSAVVLSTLLILSGCNTTEEPTVEPTVGEQKSLTIGVSLSSPGLISGTDPESLSGAEVDLAVALGEQLGEITEPNDVAWVPTTPEQTTEQLENGELDLLIGQFPGPDLTEDIAWVGPYATVEPALLVRGESSDQEEATNEAMTPENITSFDDLEDAAVCVVARSASAGLDLPVGETQTQQTVAECETGIRSGRYDAIAADDLQLVGVLADPSYSGSYELLPWSELAEDDDADVSEALVEPTQYWIGTTPAQCEVVGEAFAELVANDVPEDIFGQWDEYTDYVPQLSAEDDLSTQYCPN